MSLHLPPALRAALVAAFAVFASVATSSSALAETASVTWLTIGPDGKVASTQQDNVAVRTSDTHINLGIESDGVSKGGNLTSQIKSTSANAVEAYGLYGTAVSGSDVLNGIANPYVGNIMMDVAEGKFSLVSGSISNEWGSKIQNAALTGDTHVQLSGSAYADHVIGGNHKGAGTTLTGSTHVTITGNAIVGGMIVGGNTSAHNSTTTITQNTSVLVTNVQYDSQPDVTIASGNYTIDIGRQNLLVGGSAFMTNSNSSTTVEGNTSVLIDLSGHTPSATEANKNLFVKNIVGGSYAENGLHTIKGDSSVTIHGKEGVTFTGDIYGGSLWQFNNNDTKKLETQGSTSVTIDGGSTFLGRIVGGSWGRDNFNNDTRNEKVSITKDINLTLGAGTYLGDIYGMGNLGTVSGNVTITLDGAGTYGLSNQTITIAGAAAPTSGTLKPVIEGQAVLNLTGEFKESSMQHATLARFDSIEAASDVTVAALTDMGDLEKKGEGKLTVNTAAALTGAITINAGGLAFADTAATSIGNLTLASGTSFSTAGDLGMGENLTMACDSSITVGGALTGTAYTITISNAGYLNTPDELTLLSAGSSLDGVTFTLSPIASATGLDYELVKEGSELKLRATVGDNAWNWENGTQWSDASTGDGWGLTAAAGTAAGKALFFTDDGLGGQAAATVDVKGGVTPASITVSNAKDTTYTFASSDGTGKLMGGDLLKAGEGALYVNVDISSWGGKVTLSGGTLGFGSALKAVNGATISVTGDATLDLTHDVERATELGANLTIQVADAATSVTHSGVISGTGELTKSGEGTLELSGANTFTGDVEVAEGTLKLGSGSALGAAGTVTVSQGATLDVNGFRTNPASLVISGDGADGKGALINTGDEIDNTLANLANITLAGDASIGGTSRLSTANGKWTQTSIDLAGHNLTKQGTNLMEFAGTQFTAGTLTIEEGTAKFTCGVNAAAVDVVVNGGTLDLSSGGATVKSLNGTGGEIALYTETEKKAQGIRITEGGSYGGKISGDGCNVWLEGGTLTLTGQNTATGTINIASGAKAIIGDGTTDGQWVGSISGEGAVELNNQEATISLKAHIPNQDAQALTGTAELNGAGKVVLLAADSFGTAKVTVNNGVLDMNSQAVANAVTITKGSLANAGSATSLVTVDAVAGESAANPNIINLGGLAGAQLASINLAANSQLAGAGSSIDMTGKEVSLTLGAGNLSYGSTTGTAVIDSGLTLTAALTTLDLSDAALQEVMRANLTNEAGVELVISSGTLVVDNYGAIIFTPELTNLGYVVTGVQGGSLLTQSAALMENPYREATSSENAATGADLVWAAMGSATGEGSQLSEMKAVINALYQTDPEEANRAAAAVAGSTVTSLSMAQRDALRGEMDRLRNRVSTMGAPQGYHYEDLPFFHAWIQGNGSYSDLSADGDEAGYDLTTWGGTVGFDVDLSDSATLGMALSANYGDISAEGADIAEGDLDSYYVSLFARLQSGSWTHLFVVTGGLNDASLTRTVDYGGGSYSATGDTSGFGIGAMYEVTYDIALDEDGETVFQPLFNASFVTASLDSYEEEGAGNAGLRVDEQQLSTATLALGARLRSTLGENLLGRKAWGELRVNVAQDLGDTQGEAEVGFIGVPGTTGKVYGAEAGSTAIQVGAGLSLPLGTYSNIFFDASADFRSGATSASGSVGYRVDF